MQVAQYVPVLTLFAVQICTPGVDAFTMHKRTSCSMHGHIELIASFHAHSRGVVCKQVAPEEDAQSGITEIDKQSELPAH